MNDDMSGAVFVRTLQLQHDLAGAIALEPVVGDGRSGDVAAELLRPRSRTATPRRSPPRSVRITTNPSRCATTFSANAAPGRSTTSAAPSTARSGRCARYCARGSRADGTPFAPPEPANSSRGQRGAVTRPTPSGAPAASRICRASRAPAAAAVAAPGAWHASAP